MAAPKQVSWRDEIADGQVPTSVPRDEWDQARREILERMLRCDGCACGPSSINSENLRVVGPGTTTPGATRQLETWGVSPAGDVPTGWLQSAHGSGERLVIGPAEIRGRVTNGECHVVENACVEKAKCVWHVEFVFSAVTSAAALPTITFNAPHANANDVAPVPHADGANWPKAGRYVVPFDVSIDCGDDYEEEIEGTDFTLSAAGWTFAAPTAQKIKLAMTCRECSGGVSEEV